MMTFTGHVKSYFQNTSLHGLQYVGEDGRSFLEKIIWLVLFLLGIVLMIIFFIPGIQKYMYTPTSTSLSTTDYPVMNVDFPGVTICPNTKIMKSRFRAAMSSKKLPWANLTKKLEDANEGAGAAFQYSLLDHLANMLLFSTNPAAVTPLEDADSQKILDEMSKNVSSLLRTVAPDCDRMILLCRWHGEFRNCSDMFTSSKTDDGFCCSFNTVSLAEGFAKEVKFGDSGDSDNDYYDDYYDDYAAGADYEYEFETVGSAASFDSCDRISEKPKSGNTALWYTGCYMNNEDACLEDKIKGSDSASSSFTDVLDDDKALTVSKLEKIKRRRTNGASKLLGLSILLDPALHDNIDVGVSWEDQQRLRQIESDAFKGWKLHVHDPGEFPEVNKKGMQIGLGKEVSISVSAVVTEADDNVKTMDPNRRKCLLRNEIKTELYEMKMFNEYKKSSCLLECQATELLKIYGCLPYYMPKLPAYFIRKFKPNFGQEGSNDTVECTFEQLQKMSLEIEKFSALGQGKNGSGFVSGLQCEECPDECESTEYSARISYADFRDPGNFFYNNLLRKGTAKKPVLNQELFKEYSVYAANYFANFEVNGPPVVEKDPRPEYKSCLERTIRNKVAKMSYVHVYFKSFGMTKFSRDLIAFFGGICGLCLGFSLLSGAELIYWFTIRLCIEEKKDDDEDDATMTSTEMLKVNNHLKS